MVVARHGTGPRHALAALSSQIHPVFMLPPLAMSLFGGILAPGFDPAIQGFHALAMFFAVYTAHIKDGYVDFFQRNEDDDHPLTPVGCKVALAGASLGFVGALVALWLGVGYGAVVVTAPTWFIAYFHAPQLDVTPLGATLGYPVGISLCLLGGFYVQAASISGTVVALAVVFFLLLSGIKVVDDAQDFEYDRSIGKRTAAVVLGRVRARRLAFALMGIATMAIVPFAAAEILPPSGVFAAVAFGVVALVARNAEPELATKLLIRGSYVFLAVLVAAVWLRPLA